jgi:hypothetical protein
VPKEDDAFARRFLDSIRAGDYAAADQMLDAPLRGEQAANGLHGLNGILAHGEPLSIEVIGCNIFTNTSAHGTTRTTNLSYQIHFTDSWVVGNVAVGHPGNSKSVLGSHFRPIPDSLEALNRFTFAGKSLVHYLVLAACIVVPVFILVALIICIRSRIRRKWLWILFLLFGFVQFQLDWTSGHVGVQPVSFLLFGASALRSSPYASWVFGFGIPMGAIIFLAFRRKLLVEDATQQPQPSDGTNVESTRGPDVGSL